MSKSIGPGSEIDAYCTKCKLDLNHRVIAMDGGRPKRVECLTCRGHHNYRRPKSDEPVAQRASRVRATSGATPRAPKSAELLRSTWEKAIMGRSPSEFTSYNVSLALAPGQLVRHKKFGDGVVSELVDGGKANVLFADGQKLLVHGR